MFWFNTNVLNYKIRRFRVKLKYTVGTAEILKKQIIIAENMLDYKQTEDRDTRFTCL